MTDLLPFRNDPEKQKRYEFWIKVQKGLIPPPIQWNDVSSRTLSLSFSLSLLTIQQSSLYYHSQINFQSHFFINYEYEMKWR
jgi:hypothetical protein